MRRGQSVKSAGTVKMVPAAAGAAPAVLEKNIAANNWKLVPFRQGTGFFLRLHSRQGCNIILIGL